MNKSKHFSGHPIIKQTLNLIPSSIITRTAEKHDKDEDPNEWALAHGYISVVPVQFDLTTYQAMDHLHQWGI